MCGHERANLGTWARARPLTTTHTAGAVGLRRLDRNRKPKPEQLDFVNWYKEDDIEWEDDQSLAGMD
jgi:hypothetical protein